ncbi:Sensor protein NarQ-like protein [Frankliniella fusca]|uniref:Sensor protein NarQ-like protein n=1 Tax=Frankliniella fusca TaxID=407009 RepID=A0AAE1HR38_9NEOP|nr:Sensor protein NarQ-like protein [Frankliniella fusca]
MPFMKKKEKERRLKVSTKMTEKWAKVRTVKAFKEELTPVIAESGRRVIDLQLFARQMWCEECDVPLSLRFLEEERRIGLASKFFVRCHQCLARKEVLSSALAPRTTEDGRALYAINCKAAIACVDSGVGHEQFNKVLSAMNLPTIHANTIVTPERRMGPSIVEVAEQSCRDAILEERELTLRKSSRTHGQRL